MLFAIQPEKALVGDMNQGLIEAYQCIKSDWEAVEEKLQVHQLNHCSDYYYHIRDQMHPDPVGRAAQFIYLNRTCWNGLYRVNKKGKFNVPIGTKSSVLLDSDNFGLISEMLQKTELICADFESVLDRTRRGDFVFVDPPYTVKHNYNGFIKYNETIFSWEDQVRLRDAIQRSISRGAKVLVTNACHESVKAIYSQVGEITQVSRSSVIAGRASARGEYEEILVKCY